MKRKLLITYCAMLLGLMQTFSSYAQNPAIQSFSAGSTFSGTWTLGWRFSTSTTITVYELGAFDVGNDGLNGDIPVTIWDEGTQNIVLRDTVPAGTTATLSNGWRYISVSPTVLPPGTYSIGAYTASSDLNQSGTPAVDPDITFLTGCWDNNDVFPSNASGGPYMNPNFKFSACTGTYAMDTVAVSACDSIMLNGNTYDSSQTLIDTIGCDSIITTHLTINTVEFVTKNASINSGGSFVVGSHTYTAAGTYIDTLVASTGCDSIVTTHLTINTNNGISLVEAGISIYPNPSSGIITIQSHENIQKIQILNIESKVIYSDILNNNNQTIDVSSFEKGLYIITLTTENDITVREKLVIH